MFHWSHYPDMDTNREAESSTLSPDVNLYALDAVDSEPALTNVRFTTCFLQWPRGGPPVWWRRFPRQQAVWLRLAQLLPANEPRPLEVRREDGGPQDRQQVQATGATPAGKLGLRLNLKSSHNNNYGNTWMMSQLPVFGPRWGQVIVPRGRHRLWHLPQRCTQTGETRAGGDLENRHMKSLRRIRGKSVASHREQLLLSPDTPLNCDLFSAVQGLLRRLPAVGLEGPPQALREMQPGTAVLRGTLPQGSLWQDGPHPRSGSLGLPIHQLVAWNWKLKLKVKQYKCASVRFSRGPVNGMLGWDENFVCELYLGAKYISYERKGEKN